MFYFQFPDVNIRIENPEGDWYINKMASGDVNSGQLNSENNSIQESVSENSCYQEMTLSVNGGRLIIL